MAQEENNHCVAVAQSPQPHFNLIEILSLDINTLVQKLSKFLLNDMKDWLNDNKNNYFKLLLPQEVLQATESQSGLIFPPDYRESCGNVLSHMTISSWVNNYDDEPAL